MAEENPFQSPESSAPEKGAPEPQAEVTSDRAAYNVVTDLVAGPNLRGADNKFQAKCIAVAVLVCTVLSGGYAAIWGGEDYPLFVGLIVGVFAGLILGTFGSGIYLMVYRAVRHAKGKHD